jgi:hypothetical protein
MVGWKEEGGKRAQQPFYFGNDLVLQQQQIRSDSDNIDG